MNTADRIELNLQIDGMRVTEVSHHGTYTLYVYGTRKLHGTVQYPDKLHFRDRVWRYLHSTTKGANNACCIIFHNPEPS